MALIPSVYSLFYLPPKGCFPFLYRVPSLGFFPLTVFRGWGNKIILFHKHFYEVFRQLSRYEDPGTYAPATNLAFRLLTNGNVPKINCDYFGVVKQPRST